MTHDHRDGAHAATPIGQEDEDAGQRLTHAGRFWLLYVAFIAAVAAAGVLTLINNAPKP